MQALEKCGCKKVAIYELLRTDMVRGLTQAFTRHHEKISHA